MREEEVRLQDGPAIRIRPATLDDAAALLENINLVCAEEVFLLMDDVPYDLEREREWIAGFDGQRSALFLAVHDGAIVGQVDCRGGEFSKTRHVGLVGIAIRDGWREVGLGRILMSRILEWMRARSFRKADLSVFATNTRARRLYESMGFEVEGIQRRQFRIRGEYVDGIQMGLWLGP
ncbi:MAG: hypothetical protein A3K68_02530 [Euryarchaeota archaeon RBG_16_68_13]|nr:MAG: hypothetical protein A3K68_02530 [Euryarchaeota archaeon RBG_16_68_13]